MFPRRSPNRSDVFFVISWMAIGDSVRAPLQCLSKQNSEFDVSAGHIWRYLLKAGYKGRVCVRKPLLRAQNNKKRLAWAHVHKAWTEQQWNRVRWSDEKKLELFDSKIRQYYQRIQKERNPSASLCLYKLQKGFGGSWKLPPY